MKKRVVIIVCAVLVLFLIIAHFIPSYTQKAVLIHSPIIRVATELNSPAEWQRWNPIPKKYCLENGNACVADDKPVQTNFAIAAGQHSFTIAAHGASYDITETDNGNTSLYNYTLVSSIYNDTTSVVVTENTNLLSSLLPSNGTNALEYADSLKSFIENPSAFYGFPLRLSPIIDTAVITKQAVVLNKNSAAVLKGLYKQLDDFIQANHLNIIAPRIARYEPKGSDSTDVTAAVPVDKILAANSVQNGIIFLKMPLKAPMLIGSYKGSFSGRIKLYQAMYKYLGDHRLKPASGTEYDEYLNNIIPDSDSSMIEINVCIPYL